MVQLERGWHLVADRRLFSHHGIYMGSGEVVHFTGEPPHKAGASVQRSTLASFIGGSPLLVRSYLVDLVDMRLPGEVCAAAEELLEQSRSSRFERYHLINHNCEHLATYCKIRVFDSGQVRSASQLFLGMPAVALAANPVGWPWRGSRRCARTARRGTTIRSAATPLSAPEFR